MGRTVGVSDYWMRWLDKVVKSGIRKSKSEIVEEGLKAIQDKLEYRQNEEELDDVGET